MIHTLFLCKLTDILVIKPVLGVMRRDESYFVFHEKTLIIPVFTLTIKIYVSKKCGYQLIIKSDDWIKIRDKTSGKQTSPTPTP